MQRRLSVCFLLPHSSSPIDACERHERIAKTSDMAKERFEIAEHDEAGNITATYVASPTDTKGTSRVDVIVGPSLSS